MIPKAWYRRWTCLPTDSSQPIPHRSAATWEAPRPPGVSVRIKQTMEFPRTWNIFLINCMYILCIYIYIYIHIYIDTYYRRVLTLLKGFVFRKTTSPETMNHPAIAPCPRPWKPTSLRPWCRWTCPATSDTTATVRFVQLWQTMNLQRLYVLTVVCIDKLMFILHIWWLAKFVDSWFIM